MHLVPRMPYGASGIIRVVLSCDVWVMKKEAWPRPEWPDVWICLCVVHKLKAKADRPSKLAAVKDHTQEHFSSPVR